jgi:hypothetical protein
VKYSFRGDGDMKRHEFTSTDQPEHVFVVFEDYERVGFWRREGIVHHCSTDLTFNTAKRHAEVGTIDEKIVDGPETFDDYRREADITHNAYARVGMRHANLGEIRKLRETIISEGVSPVTG